MKKFDKDSSGFTEFGEFVEMYKSLKGSKVSVNDVTKAFNHFDSDGNGYLDKNEFKHFICNYGAKLSEAEVDKFFNNVDIDGDGRISLDEFKKILEKN